MVTRELVDHILDKFRLKLNGLHGPAHWARVIHNGRLLAERTGADPDVVELFAVFHDCGRRNEQDDPGHGKRAADFAETLRGILYDLPDESFNLLYDACSYHDEAGTTGHITLQTCWDADRLDIGRCRLSVDTVRLCTEAAAAPDILDPAHLRATEREILAMVKNDWGLDIEIQKKSSWF